MSGCNGSEKMSPARVGGGPVRSGQKVIIAVAMEDMQVQTRGNDTDETQYALDIGQIANLGPMIEKLRVEYLCENATASFKGRVIGWWSIKGDDWEPFAADILGYQTSTKQIISADYTTTTDFGLKLKMALVTVNVAGQNTAVHYGRVTVIIEATLKS